MSRNTELNTLAPSQVEVVAPVGPEDVEVVAADTETADVEEFAADTAIVEGEGAATDTETVDGAGVYAAPEPAAPGGIKFLGWLNIIAGVGMSILSLAGLSEGGPDAGGIILFAFLLAGLSVLVGVGLLNLRPWARVVAIIGYGFNLLIGLAGFPGTLIQVLVAGWILTYLFSEKVRDAFSQTAYEYE